MQYALIKRKDQYYVDGLPEEFGNFTNTLLIVRYDEGDCDTVHEPGEKMERALYDLYQCSSTLKDGDAFAIDGKPLYICKGVHVLPIEPAIETA